MDLKAHIIQLVESSQKEEAFKYLKARYILTKLPELFESEAHIASSDSLEVDKAAAVYDALEAMSSKTALNLSDLVNKVKQTIQKVKEEAPSIKYNLSELLKTDVLDVNGIHHSLTGLIDALNTEDEKAKEKAPYKYTKDSISVRELTELANKVAKLAADEYSQMFDQSDTSGQYWNVLKTEAAKFIIQMDPLVRSRFVKLIEQAGRDNILKLSPGYRSSFTAAEKAELDMWDESLQSDMQKFIQSPEFKKNVVIATMGLKIFPEQVDSALEKLNKNSVWNSLYQANDTPIVGTSWIHGFNKLFLTYLAEDVPDVTENEPFLQKALGNLLETHATDLASNR